ncbi:MAG: hypothetical protein A2Z24_00155 [Candidatus Woykebacteria bacterium RBG_16_44_10]|uniref:Four helix bundle protein n=1 Tax=Candidatus Woykebacteria bacterium RBG_16_44_10 TaxID=1802597 RepID=A0A1G1WFX4_9BACT|nr:MAG: hypothetical protein A2Z24_00155 [Candidatus Woykebacteria bacterium RBG_16_44_10]
MKNNIDIHDRVKRFILRIIKMTKALPKTPENKIFINQVIRSSTSIGANLQEADGAHTKADFIYSMNLGKKEAKETTFWLDLINECNSQLNLRMKPLINEGVEIVNVISAIVLSGKRNI